MHSLCHHSRGLVLAIALSLLLWPVSLEAQEATGSRFYFSGDGFLKLSSAHSDERIEVRYRNGDGLYDPAAQNRIEKFFRSRGDGKAGAVSLRLIELLAFVEDRFHLTHVELVSGYRSPDFNQDLRSQGRRVAQASLHTEGLAADIAPAGVNLRRLWFELRDLRIGGVGLYQHDGFLHIDTGPPRFWEAATSGVEKDLSADNARIFARTDFDRYADLSGAVVDLYSVTALPLRIAREASVSDQTVTLATQSDASLEDDCWVIRDPSERYEFKVETSVLPPAQRTSMRLRTCTPRVGATADEILTNPIERLRPIGSSGDTHPRARRSSG